jgi:serine/threonine protein kinase
MLSGAGEKLEDAGGTPAFMAPELCENKSFSGQLADIWAIGATVFMLKFGHPPFIAKNIVNLYFKICNDPLVFPSNTSIDPGLKNLLEGLLDKNPEKRFTMSQIVAHPWFRYPPNPNAGLVAPSKGTAPAGVHRPNGPPGPSGVRSPHHGSDQGQNQGGPGGANGQSNNANGNNKNAGATAGASNQSNSHEVGPEQRTSGGSLSFQPPPTYDAEEAEAMKGPIHSASVNEVYMSIGGIKNLSDPDMLKNAIVDIDDDIDEEVRFLPHVWLGSSFSFSFLSM